MALIPLSADPGRDGEVDGQLGREPDWPDHAEYMAGYERGKALRAARLADRQPD